MDRAELETLRDAIDVLLKCPDAIREQLVRWFAPGSAKPNGHDLHPHPPPPVRRKPRPPPRPMSAQEQARQAKDFGEDRRT